MDKEPKGGIFDIPAFFSQADIPIYVGMCRGSVLKGESSIEGAVREVKEEVGLDLEQSAGKLLFSKICGTLDGKVFNNIMDVWLFNYNGEVHLEDATTDEVADCKWMTVPEIRQIFVLGFGSFVILRIMENLI